MHASVIIRTRNEAARLRLTLASLACQSEAAEIIVVDDGSTDDTAAVAAHAAMRLRYVRHATPQGRAGAANAGAARAGGDVLIFLDGDTLAGPDFVARHLAVHRARGGVVARGETYHLRGTRWLADPATGAPMPGQDARVAALPPLELAEMLITPAAVAGDFAAIHRRARQGVYPGAGPARLYGLEMAALHGAPDCSVLWAAASGANQSVPEAAFRAAGGFDPRLTINEHRELALRLCRQGLAMVAAQGARSYHMIHRSGWRDPLADTAWETLFYQRHPLPEVALLAVFWAGLAGGGLAGSSLAGGSIPDNARIDSLPELQQAAARCAGVTGVAAVRLAHLAACARTATNPAAA